MARKYHCARCLRQAVIFLRHAERAPRNTTQNVLFSASLWELFLVAGRSKPRRKMVELAGDRNVEK